MTDADVLRGLPVPPANARYVVRADPGGCVDWGAFGWALTEVEDSRWYKYVMFINSSVRGPFLPAYWPVRGTAALVKLFTRLHHAVDRRLPLSSCRVTAPPCHRGVASCAGRQALDNSIHGAPEPRREARESLACCAEGTCHWRFAGDRRDSRSETVAQVGSTISCGGIFRYNDPTQHTYRKYPHVQSYIMATDQARSCTHHQIDPDPDMLRSALTNSL